MAKIVESLKRLSVEHGTRKHDDNRTVKRKSELISSIEEAVSLDHNYILAVCGTQRQILLFLMKQFMSNLLKKSIIFYNL